MTNLKLQKLLYIAHGVMLGAYNRPLLSTTFSAWKYGPVVDSLYHDLKVFGSDVISNDAFYIQNWSQIPTSDQMAINSIDAVLNHYGRMSGASLIDWSHRTDGPWHAVFEDHSKNLGIENEAIKKYFKEKVLKPN